MFAKFISLLAVSCLLIVGCSDESSSDGQGDTSLAEAPAVSEAQDEPDDTGEPESGFVVEANQLCADFGTDMNTLFEEVSAATAEGDVALDQLTPEVEKVSDAFLKLSEEMSDLDTDGVDAETVDELVGVIATMAEEVELVGAEIFSGASPESTDEANLLATELGINC